jgi:hypothetical protein
LGFFDFQRRFCNARVETREEAEQRTTKAGHK